MTADSKQSLTLSLFCLPEIGIWKKKKGVSQNNVLHALSAM